MAFKGLLQCVDTNVWTYPSGDASFQLPGIIAAVFPSVSDASIRLQGKAIEHVFESPNEIFSSIKNFYVNETLSQGTTTSPPQVLTSTFYSYY